MTTQRSIELGIVLGIVLGVVLGGACASPAAGQEEPPAEPNQGALHFSAGIDWTNKYFFRGLVQEDDGFIVQPWLELGIDLLENDSVELGAFVGIWNSLHGETATAGTSDQSMEHWYESDIYGGLSLTTGEWGFSATYTFYTSPSDAFSTIEELSFGVSYDDSGLWGGAFALNPSVLVAFETDDHGGTEDSYLELGIAPGFEVTVADDYAVQIDVPLTLGLGLDDYYVDASGDDDAFGYFDAGVEATFALPVSADYGAWSLSAGVHGLFLGNAAEDANGGDDAEVIATFGLSIEY